MGRHINGDALVSTGQGLLSSNIFVYCLNNPVNRTDTCGTYSLWYYLIVDHDMGFIHRTVQAHIQNTYNVRTEVRLSGFGRADIVRDSAVWEVKHAGKNPLQRMVIAYAEASGYVLLNDELDTLGEPNAFSGTLYIGCEGFSYEVEYCTPFWGAVLYTVKEIQNYNGEYAAVYVPVENRSEKESLCMAGAGALVGIPVGGSLGSGLPASLTRQRYSLF